MKGMRFMENGIMSLSQICKCYFVTSPKLQKLYHFNQYLFNELILNPATAGSTPCKMMGLNIRKQWAGFAGSPETQDLFFHGPFF